MQFDEYDHLQSHHPAWALLRAQNAPLVLSFLGGVFVDENSGAQPASTLSSLLDDELYALNQRLGPSGQERESGPSGQERESGPSGQERKPVADAFPRSASAYLDDWAAPERGWLRKFYPPASDEAHYDLSPAVEKALLWVRDLRAREFVGTESRLNTVFELLRQMAFGADEDPQRRLEDLRRRRDELDAEIDRTERGEITMLDAISQLDRYQQFSRTARELLSDFREVEENFRRLDRSLREQIAGWSGSKGDLLDDILGNRNGIAESDQGRSFQAFYDVLLSHDRQAELSDLLERVAQIEHLAEQDLRLSRVHFDWIDASERAQATVRLLSEQLRRFLDDQVWLENRRVFDVLRSIESQALELREHNTSELEFTLASTSTSVNLPFERPLYQPQRSVAIDSESVVEGDHDFDSSALHNQLYVDRESLVRTVRQALRDRAQVGMGEVIESAPLQQGLAELITYLSLNEHGIRVLFDEAHRERIDWIADDVNRTAELARTTFTKESS